MNRLLAFFIVLAGFGFFGVEADAASRLGGGRSSGMQRQMAPQPPKAPQQQQAAPRTPQQQQAAPATQPQPSGWRRWLGPLAGLALGAGLAALFFHNGMGGALLGILLIGA